MRTIQEYLRECNREEIIWNYLLTHGLNRQHLMEEKYKDVTFGEYVQRYKKTLNEYIDRLISIKPKPEDDETWILMTIHIPETEGEDIRHILVKKSEIMDESVEFFTPWGYELTRHEVSVGFFVADTYLTQYYIDDLIVDFLYETSFTGFEQEGLKKTLDRLEESAKGIEEGTAKTVPAEEVLEELENEFGVFLEKRDPREKEAWKKWLSDTVKYSMVCRNVEAEKLRKMLLDDESDN